MIKDVSIKKITQYHDDRGFFSEVAKAGEESYHPIKQTSYAETFPGVIKAFHWHKKQWDMWFIVKGSAQVVLYDLREKSPTKGETQVIYTGNANKMLISIPPGVAHGYRVLGTEPLGVFYHTTEAYDPKDPDELRIPFDSKDINFDWTTKNK
jgi:dTDP-4-dehydrorhamnose 3,5-epimerase